MVKYAEQKNDPANPSQEAFVGPWEICPNCKQAYQNQLSLDLSSAFVSFAEAAYGHPGNSIFFSE
jgi:hypothetical protein